MEKSEVNVSSNLLINSSLKKQIMFNLYSTLNTTLINQQEKQEIINNILILIIDDLKAFAQRDPASKGSCEYIWNSYSAFKAIFYYRIATILYHYKKSTNTNKLSELKKLARQISEKSKIETGIEIHPGAKIGSRFICDHGTGTVIGETAVIGNDCYFLQGIILGVSKFGKVLPGNKRHPSIGNNVRIGAFAKVLGPITIGNNSVISPQAVVTEDIPDNSNLIIVNQYQLLKPEQNIELYGVTPYSKNYLIVHGKGLKNTSLSILGKDQSLLYSCKIIISRKCDKFIIFTIKNNKSINTNKISLAVIDKNKCVVAVIRESLALKRFFEKKLYIKRIRGRLL